MRFFLKYTRGSWIMCNTCCNGCNACNTCNTCGCSLFNTLFRNSCNGCNCGCGCNAARVARNAAANACRCAAVAARAADRAADRANSCGCGCGCDCNCNRRRISVPITGRIFFELPNGFGTQTAEALTGRDSECTTCNAAVSGVSANNGEFDAYYARQYGLYPYNMHNTCGCGN